MRTRLWRVLHDAISAANERRWPLQRANAWTCRWPSRPTTRTVCPTPSGPLSQGWRLGERLPWSTSRLSGNPNQPWLLPVCSDPDAAAAEAVNLYEAPASRNYWAACSVSGLLIHAVVGSLGGWGSLRTNRSGWAAKEAMGTSAPAPRPLLCLAQGR